MEYAPGVHSRNAIRAAGETLVAPKLLLRLRLVLLIIGAACLGYFAYSLADEFVYQSYENWAFDQLIAGRTSVHFLDYIRSRLGRDRPPNTTRSLEKQSSGLAAASTASAAPPLSEGDLVGRVGIGRLNISAIVREGVSDSTLSNAVGHVPGTALPGQAGNFAVAAHRDTLFRALKDIQNGDAVTVETPTAAYKYIVKASEIVKPTDIRVLTTNGGGLISDSSSATPKLLTMVTCYPFRFVGSAPKRFIVEAELAPPELNLASVQGKPPLPVAKPATAPTIPSMSSSKPMARGGFGRTRAHPSTAPVSAPRQHARTAQAKKRGFWYRLFHEMTR
jgi:sortase A